MVSDELQDLPARRGRCVALAQKGVRVIILERQQTTTMGANRAQFTVGGMSCSFCAESIEKAYSRTDGVADVDVSLAREEVLDRYDDAILSEYELKDTLRDLGYTIRDPDKTQRSEEQQAELIFGRQRLLFAGSASLVTAGLMLWMIVLMGDRLGGVMDAYEIWTESYRKTRQSQTARSFR